MKEHKHAEVLRAIADGQEAEYLYVDKWLPMTINRSPLTDPEYTWRIKPKPPIVIERHYMKSDISDDALVVCYPEHKDYKPNVRFTFDPDTKLPIKVELI